MVAATLLALAAAALHAGWNLIVKTSDDRELAAWGQFLAGSLLFLPILLYVGLPPGPAWWFLIGSGLAHLVYVEGLVRAYHHGDFSFAYPLARGGGALVGALLGAALLDDNLEPMAWAALAVVAAGLISLVRPGATRASIGWASFTALIIGGYTAIDTAGVRRVGEGAGRRFGYGIALTVCAAAALTVVGIARGRGGELVSMMRTRWPLVLLSGLCLTGAYSLVLVAVSIPGVDLGYVATLRESAVVIGALVGWVFLKERLGGARLVSSAVVLAGMIWLITVG
jgi:multidrug transporter EmrE-like cation transporter